MSTHNSPTKSASSDELLLPLALPPRCMQVDDRAEAERARKKVSAPQRRKLFSLNSLRRHRRKSNAEDSKPRADAPRPTSSEDGGPADPPVNVERPPDEGDESVDVYRWAVLYENQRGFALLGGAYYSCLSLLPNDPPPYTIPLADPRARQPKCSLTEYPLPDGTWQWVSRDWMIDMRGEGAVQHDGFEYNWTFRSKNWRAHVGALSAGGLVRRRRWVRLMVRPASVKRRTGAPSAASSPAVSWLDPPSGAYSFVSSGTGSGSAALELVGEVWQGDAEADWIRCRALMRRVGRDGRRLELWKTWLSAHIPPEGETRRVKQWTEDDGPMPSESEYEKNNGKGIMEVNKEAIAAVIRAHGKDVLDSMVYPDSRAQFVELLARADLLPDFTLGLGIPDTENIGDIVDFWSYNKDSS